MTYKIKQKKPKTTKVGDLIVRNNQLYKVISIKKDKQGRMLKLRPL